ncbi:MAG: hypothetical protein ACE5JH_00730 [Acidobacteriota bacterium]
MGEPTHGDRPAVRAAGLCRHLRTKTYYYGSADDALGEAGLSTTAQFWCLRTTRPVGPDERPASARSCRPGRDCCDLPPGGRAS